MRMSLFLPVSMLIGGCVETTLPAAPPAPATHLASDPGLRVGSAEAPSSTGGSSVRVLTGRDPGRPCEVVGVLDFHTNAESADKGFDQLRAKAESMGADTVIGAEFEHGHDDELSHLSGMAVRCGSAPVVEAPLKTTSEDESWN